MVHMHSISWFRGEHAFLSNFEPCSVPVGSVVAPSVEHAFQMMKTFSEEAFRWVCASETPVVARRRGKKVPMRDDWFSVRVLVMEQALRRKFTPGSELASKLLATGDAELVEGNNWKDSFWGVYRGKGENNLGKLLMRIRGELRQGPAWTGECRTPVPHATQPSGFVAPAMRVRKVARRPVQGMRPDPR
jgi:N-glycosidase YbiA